MWNFNIFLYIFFSTLDGIAAFTFMFTLFRIPMQHFRYHIIFISVVIGYVAYTLRVIEGLNSLAFLITVIVAFLFVWLMFRIQVFYALFISVISYISYAFFQIIVFFIVRVTAPINLNDLESNFPLLYSLQLATVVLTLVVSRILRYFDIGFNFVPHDDMSKIKLTKDNIFILIAIVISICIVDIIYLIAFSSTDVRDSVTLFISILVGLLILVGFALKKEKEDDL